MNEAQWKSEHVNWTRGQRDGCGKGRARKKNRREWFGEEQEGEKKIGPKERESTKSRSESVFCRLLYAIHYSGIVTFIR